MQRILHRIAAAPAQIQFTQIRVHLLVIGHWRHNAMLQNFQGNHIFHTHTHGMAGKAFGISHHNLFSCFAKSLPQRHHFRRRRTAARRGIRLVGHEHQLWGNGVAVEAKTSFGRSHQVIHHLGNVVYVQPGAVEGAVAGFAAE